MSGRFYRNRRRYYRRRYYRRGYGRGASRRANGNMRAARQQADNATFTINVPSKISTFMKSGVQLPGLPTGQFRTVGVYPLSVYDLLRRNEFFNNYSNMYDEFKVDKIKIKLLPTSFTINTNGNYRNLTVYTAWDRTGLNTTQLYGYTDLNRPENNKLYCTIGEDITTYSSAESRTVNPNTNTSITRWLNPKTMNERSQWLSTSLLKKWYDQYDDENGCFTGINFSDDDSYTDLASIQTQGNSNNALIKWSAAARDNPCFLLEDPSIKFKPTLLIGVFPSVTSGDFSNNSNRIHFNVETEIVCTYRGLRKARVLTASSESGQQLIVGPKPSIIRSNGTYRAINDGLNGYSEVQVQVPDSGSGGGDDPEMEDNRLQFVLTDEVIATALDRIDETSTGLDMKGIIEWPLQPGGVQWPESVVQTNDNKDAKWVDAAVVDVSNVHIAERWSQRSNLSPANVATTLKNGVSIANAQYPEDFNFTRNSNIYYNNNNQNNVLVDLRNDYVNCFSTKLNIGDITTKNYSSTQEEINATPILDPGTHGVYVEDVNTGSETKKVVHFTFDLTDGSHVKTTGSGSGVDIQTPLPRIYARSIEGYFDLPQLQRNLVINQSGTYEFGSFDNNQSDLEFQLINNSNNSSENITPIPKSLTLIKKDGNLRDDSETDPNFSFGTFTVDIPSTTYNLNRIICDNFQTNSDIIYNNEYMDIQDFSKYINYGDTEEIEFVPGTSDEGKWACIYWNSSICGGFVFDIPSVGDNYYLNLFNNNTQNQNDKLNRIVFQIDEEINEGTEGTVVLDAITMKGFSDESNLVKLPLSFNSRLTQNLTFDLESDVPNKQVRTLSINGNFKTDSSFTNVIQMPYDNSIFHIEDALIEFDSPETLTKSKNSTRRFK